MVISIHAIQKHLGEKNQQNRNLLNLIKKILSEDTLGTSPENQAQDKNVLFYP